MRRLTLPTALALFLLVALAASIALAQQPAKSRIQQRLEPAYLARLHQAVLDFRAQRQPVTPTPGLTDYRVVLHAHSNLSHDSPGTREQIVAGAHASGTKAIFMSEHPAPTYDFFADGLHGIFDGVLFYPGAENRGFLIYPTKSTDIRAPADDQALIDEITGQGGLIFFCHPEERTNWDLHDMTGLEIYNTHADVLDEEGGVEGLVAPGGQFSAPYLVQLIAILQQYPNEVFPAIFDPNTKILQRWDELCQTQRVTGIAANDSHANVGLTASYEEGDQVVVRDVLGGEVARIPAQGLNLAALLGHQPQVGEVLLRLQFDPYDRSFGYIGTHTLATELTDSALFDALRNGRCYVSFDWIADGTGFQFEARKGDKTIQMGAEAKWRPSLSLYVTTPVPARILLLRNGQPFTQVTGSSLACSAAEPGVYRVEVWTTLAGQDYAWIYSNPIYLRP